MSIVNNSPLGSDTMWEETASPLSLSVVAHRTLHGQAYEALYQAILEGQLRPGARLVEHDISAALGISRGPVREAIRRLESEGLVVTRAHRDTHVVSLTGAAVIDLYSVRAALEGFAATSALDRLRADHLEAMDAELEDLDLAARAHDWERVAILDAAWHGHIPTAAGNARLTAFWTTSNGPLRVVFARAAHLVYHPTQVRERHAALLEVLRTGDTWTIEQAIRDHYLASARRLAEHVDQGRDRPDGSRKEELPLVTSHARTRRGAAAEARVSD